MDIQYKSRQNWRDCRIIYSSTRRSKACWAAVVNSSPAAAVPAVWRSQSPGCWPQASRSPAAASGPLVPSPSPPLHAAGSLSARTVRGRERLTSWQVGQVKRELLSWLLHEWQRVLLYQLENGVKPLQTLWPECSGLLQETRAFWLKHLLLFLYYLFIYYPLF